MAEIRFSFSVNAIHSLWWGFGGGGRNTAPLRLAHYLGKVGTTLNLVADNLTAILEFLDDSVAVGRTHTLDGIESGQHFHHLANRIGTIRLHLGVHRLGNLGVLLLLGSRLTLAIGLTGSLVNAVQQKSLMLL